MLAEGLRVTRGEDLVTLAKGEPTDENRIPTRRRGTGRARA